jgi:hypothetical protein
MDTASVTTLAPVDTGKPAVTGSQPAEPATSQPTAAPAAATAPSPQPAQPDTGSVGKLSEENSAWLTAKGFKNADDIVKSHREAEARLSQSVVIPKDDAPPEELLKFRKALGVPEKAEAYEFSLPKDLPESVPYDEQAAQSFKEFAHKEGLSQKQAAALHDWYMGQQVNGVKGIETAMAERATHAHSELIKTLGPTDGPAYTEAMQGANRVIAYLNREVPGFFQALHDAGAFIRGADGAPVVTSPEIVLALSKFGSFVNEHGALPGTGSVAAGSNPFRDGGNVTERMEIMRGDKPRARQLIIQAGKNPAEWGL